MGDLTLCGGAGCIINWLADGTDSFGDEPFVAAGDWSNRQEAVESGGM